MSKLTLEKERRTNPLVWLGAIVCAIVTIAVIITGVAVFIVYMIYQPKTPFVKVTYAQLLQLNYDRSGSLGTRMAITLLADNDNEKAETSFSEIRFLLKFHQVEMAELRSNPINLPHNQSLTLNYVFDSAIISLDKTGMDAMNAALERNEIIFSLQGKGRTNWKAGGFASVKFSARLNCQLHFSPSNGSSLGLHCSSKSG